MDSYLVLIWHFFLNVGAEQDQGGGEEFSKLQNICCVIYQNAWNKEFNSSLLFLFHNYIISKNNNRLINSPLGHQVGTIFLVNVFVCISIFVFINKIIQTWILCFICLLVVSILFTQYEHNRNTLAIKIIPSSTALTYNP